MIDASKKVGGTKKIVIDENKKSFCYKIEYSIV